MTVTADIAPGPACGMPELQAALQAARVVFVADPAAIEELARKLADDKLSARNLVIAHGVPAQPGRDGYFEPAFHVGIQAGHIDASGTMDFFDRELLKPLAEADYIGQLHQPVAGAPGRRVDGSEIKVAAVRGSKLSVGAGIRSAPDGRMVAARSGVLVYTPEQNIAVAQ